jgi:GDP-L-fucose synthase
MKKILILGGTGFFGTNLQKGFNETDSEVVSVGLESGINLLNRKDAYNLFALSGFQPDYIINAAAHVGSMKYVKDNPARVLEFNTKMLINMYEVLGDIKSKAVIINPISNCSYPGRLKIQSENLWWEGQIHESVEPYGFVKKLGYILSKAYNQQHGIKGICNMGKRKTYPGMDLYA